MPETRIRLRARYGDEGGGRGKSEQGGSVKKGAHAIAKSPFPACSQAVLMHPFERVFVSNE